MGRSVVNKKKSQGQGLTFIMRNLAISDFEISVDPDQLTSEKPSDQDPYCFHSACRYLHIITGILKADWI